MGTGRDEEEWLMKVDDEWMEARGTEAESFYCQTEVVLIWREANEDGTSSETRMRLQAGCRGDLIRNWNEVGEVVDGASLGNSNEVAGRL